MDFIDCLRCVEIILGEWAADSDQACYNDDVTDFNSCWLCVESVASIDSSRYEHEPASHSEIQNTTCRTVPS